MNANDVGRYVTELHKIPGVMSETSDMTLSGGRSATQLQAALEVLTGSGLKETEVNASLNRMYMNFNSTLGDSTKAVAEMSMTMQQLGVPAEVITTSVQKMSDQFIGLGNNTEGAIRIIQRFGESFKLSGVGPAQTERIYEGITHGIQQMDTASKAFLSSQAGGPGGLLGAFKIDTLLMEGKVDEVAKMAEEALKKQFGGRIMTRADVKTEADATELYKQQEYLKTSAFGGMAQKPEDAWKLLEAFKRGTGAEEIAKFRDPQQALEEVSAKGHARIDQTNNLLVEANNIAAKALIAQERVHEVILTRAIGTTGRNREVVLGAAERGSRGAAAASRGLMGGEGAVTTETMRTETLKGFGTLKDGFVAGTEELTDIVGNAKKRFEAENKLIIKELGSSNLSEEQRQGLLKQLLENGHNMFRELTSGKRGTAILPPSPADINRELRSGRTPAATPTMTATMAGRDSINVTTTIVHECPGCHSKKIEKTTAEHLKKHKAAGATAPQLGYGLDVPT
jgi:hypothetical protein